MLTALNNSRLAARPNQGMPAKTQESAGAWLDEGIKLASQSKFEEAIAAFTHGITVDAKFAAAYFMRGKALYAGISKVSEVTEDFKLTLLSSGTHTGEEREAANRAIADFNQTLKLDPAYIAAYNSRGFAYMSNGDYDRAIADFNQAIRLDPAYAFAYNNRGLAYMSNGDHDRAIADYNQAIRLDPAYPVAYNNRGLAYMNKGITTAPSRTTIRRSDSTRIMLTPITTGVVSIMT
jgi:tetratricopeptide (TPR) repeat protein